jgi:hypothetical protein
MRGTDWSVHSQAYLNKVARQLNERPRVGKWLELLKGSPRTLRGRLYWCKSIYRLLFVGWHGTALCERKAQRGWCRSPAKAAPKGFATEKRNNYFVRYPSMALQASSASVKELKGEPPTLMAHLF